MATIEHSALTTGELHEPKGIATANPNTVYIADGVGSGSWTATPFGSAWYRSSGGTSFTAPGLFTLMSVPAAGGTMSEFVSNGAGRLTYTGATTFTFQLNMLIGGQSSAATPIDAAIFLNGTLPGGLVVASTTTQGANEIWSVSLPTQLELKTNDYIEVYAQAFSGDLLIENLSLTAHGLI